MSDRDALRNALSLALQAHAYALLGPHAAELAENARRELEAAVQGRSERERAVLRAEAARLAAEHSELDRGRNHFIKAFRARHGEDARGYSATVKAEFDEGVAVFTSKKEDALTAATDRLLETGTQLERPA